MTVPNYYEKFRCIADKCRHSCCIGWEIDIDADTMELYSSLEGELADKIRENITGETPHFVLRENDRCPFLTANGLCEIISCYGEDALCDIRYLHPRFQNDYETFTETGLGMCCEEASRIILSCEERFSVDTPRDITSSERQFFAQRQTVFDVLQNREFTIKQRLDNLAQMYGLSLDFPIKTLCDKYLSLERLDECWTDILNTVRDKDFDESIFTNKNYQIPFEQLSVYFVFRHFACGLKGIPYSSIINFVLMSSYLIGAVWSCGYDITDSARMYSSEIEYSDENTYALMH